MEIEEIQRKVLEFEKRWETAKNIKFDTDLTMLHLSEELGELAQQLFYKKAKPEKFNEEKVKEELCDVVLVALCMADKLKMNLSEELNKKLDELSRRDLHKINNMPEEIKPKREFLSTVYIVRDGKVLLNLNQKINKFVPLGGHIEENELPCESVIREAKEESGFDIELINPRAQDKRNLAQNFDIGLDIIKPGHHHINISYIGRIIGGTQLEKSDDGTELKWFSAEELKELDTLENIKNGAIKAIEIINSSQLNL